MGKNNSYWKKHRAVERKIAVRDKRSRILIVCEGAKTEPNYFKAFRVTSCEVHVVGEGRNTADLVKSAKQKSDEAQRNKEPYDQVWCVFDKDCFSAEQFNAAVNMAKHYGFYAAWSNEAFELWYVLHFEYLSSSIPRVQYCQKLTDCFGRRYQKNACDMYETLLAKQRQAIKYAEKLCGSFRGKTPAASNPCTTVHRLVEELNKFVK